uniref:Uncharacterized protein n=1 Tax=Timema cristinae TaxID=61476 RepID=A0A7R9H103_TIMCR|nr:unnamed protein product [Timema cristinae]
MKTITELLSNDKCRQPHIWSGHSSVPSFPVNRVRPSVSEWLPIRYLFAVLGSILFCILYGYKSNLSVAIVAMVNHTAVAKANLSQASHDRPEDSATCDFHEEQEKLQNHPAGRKVDWMGHIMRRDVLLSYVIEGKGKGDQEEEEYN